MKIIPAIDLKEGRAVRLYQGDFEQQEVISENPMEVMQTFMDSGVRCIHLIDLDGALGNLEVNRSLLKKLCQRKAVGLEIQMGGGFKTLEAVEEAISWGVGKVIVGSVAVRDWELFKKMLAAFPGKIALALDVEEGFLKTQGWLEKSKISALDLAEKCHKLGVDRVIVTDISRDGTLKGANIDMCLAIKKVFQGEVIVSGGLSSLKDIERAKAEGLDGAVIGKAIYNQCLTLDEALRIGGVHGL